MYVYCSVVSPLKTIDVYTFRCICINVNCLFLFHSFAQQVRPVAGSRDDTFLSSLLFCFIYYLLFCFCSVTWCIILFGVCLCLFFPYSSSSLCVAVSSFVCLHHFSFTSSCLCIYLFLFSPLRGSLSRFVFLHLISSCLYLSPLAP